MDEPESAMMRVFYDEHAAALWRYAVRLTGNKNRAEDVVQETLLRAWRHPEVTADAERSADLDHVPDRAGPDEVESTLDRMLLSTALSQLTEEHRAVIRCAYYQGWTTAQIASVMPPTQ